ncbi:hypothetical protein D3C87_1549700 [compost metagenome]
MPVNERPAHGAHGDALRRERTTHFGTLEGHDGVLTPTQAVRGGVAPGCKRLPQGVEPVVRFIAGQRLIFDHGAGVARLIAWSLFASALVQGGNPAV